MQVQLYKWFERESSSYRYVVGVVGHNKQKLAKMLRAARAAMCSDSNVSVSFSQMETFRKNIDPKTLKQYDDDGSHFGSVVIVTNNPYREYTAVAIQESGHYQAEICFWINDPSAAAAAVQFKLINF